MYLTKKRIIIFFSIIISAYFFIPSFVSAADQRCWEKSKCIEARKSRTDVSQADAEASFYGPNAETIAACGMKANVTEEPVGFCRPVTKAETEISFAGKKVFANLGDFIKYMYQYTIMVAGVLAVIMIIVAGFQWMTAGGNSESISSAQKRIAGAMMGLFLAVLSYFILNAVNPYLLNMRLPQTWMINRQGLVPVACGQLEETQKVASAYTQNEQKGLGGQTAISSKQVDERFKTLSDSDYSIIPKEAKCGDYFFAPDGGGLTCTGSGCPQGEACIKEGEGKDSFWECKRALLAGNIKADDTLLCDDLSGNIIDNNLKLIAMFKNGDIDQIGDDLNLEDNARSYVFSPGLLGEVASASSSDKGLVGFYLGAEINDKKGLFCLIGGGSGCDDWQAIGLGSFGQCNVNLAKIAYGILNPGSSLSCGGKDGQENCSCGAISDNDKIKKLANDENFTQYLIKPADIAGYSCDIMIDRSSFPALDNSTAIGDCEVDDDTDCWEDQSIL